VDIVDKIDKEKLVKIIDLFELKNPPPEYYEKNIKVAFFFIIKNPNSNKTKKKGRPFI